MKPDSSRSDVIGRADALMERVRRPRSFVAQNPAPSQAKPDEDTQDDLADIPVLTEKVGAGETAPLATLLPTSPHSDDELLVAELQRWLIAALPTALNQATSSVVAELTERAQQELLPNLLEITKNGTRQKL